MSAPLLPSEGCHDFAHSQVRSYVGLSQPYLHRVTFAATICSGLPSPAPSGAEAFLLYRGEAFGRCLGLRGWEAPPSCPDGAEVFWEPSSKLNKDSRMRRQAYVFRPKSDGDIHYLVTFSYQQQHLENVRKNVSKFYKTFLPRVDMKAEVSFSIRYLYHTMTVLEST